MKQIIKKKFYNFGYDIQSRSTWYSHDVRRIKFLNDHHVSLVLDIGANEGQYAQSIRKAGYKNLIISFEPIKDVFDLLNQKVISDSQWQAMNIAIGDFDGYTEINISNLSQVSSILSATGLGDTDYWKGSRQQQVQVSKLDSLINELNIKDHRVWLKVDTQGFEEQVLKGCQNLIKESIIHLR